MTVGAGPVPSPATPVAAADPAWRRIFRDYPAVPLSVLLVVLIIVLELVQPGTVGLTWAGFALRAAIPLAILAGCQTLAMLTGGIDLSIGTIGSMVAVIVATQSTQQGPIVAIALGLIAAAIAGVINGVGIGVFKVHPLIMTLGTGLVVLGLMAAYQLSMTNAGTELPDAIVWLGQGLDLGGLPNSLIVFVPIAALILFGLRSTGFGRLLFAVGDNPIASRLAGSPDLAGAGRPVRAVSVPRSRRGPARRGPREHRHDLARRSVRPAVGRGRGHRRHLDHGRSRRLRGNDPRGADPDRADGAPDRARVARGRPADAVRR